MLTYDDGDDLVLLVLLHAGQGITVRVWYSPSHMKFDASTKSIIYFICKKLELTKETGHWDS